VVEHRQRRLRPALVLSFGTHAVALALAAFAIRSGAPAGHGVDRLTPNLTRLAWSPDRGGGGGGGGDDHPADLPHPAKKPGTDRRTVLVHPVAFHPSTTATADPDPVPRPAIAVQTLGDAAHLIPGALNAPESASLSQGPGTGGGAHGGRGPGDGPGDGPGLGPGKGGNEGGGPYRPGNGVTPPRLVREVKPQYTTEAMSARIQGSVWLECIVRADGSVGAVRVLHSLDSRFGLDREAIAAARQWRFVPGTRSGAAVDVLVTIELLFTLR